MLGCTARITWGVHRCCCCVAGWGRYACPQGSTSATAVQCSIGMYSTVGSQSCSSCTSGKYNDVPGSGACTLCPAGVYGNLGNLNTPACNGLCNAGRYGNAGAISNFCSGGCISVVHAFHVLADAECRGFALLPVFILKCCCCASRCLHSGVRLPRRIFQPHGCHVPTRDVQSRCGCNLHQLHCRKVQQHVRVHSVQHLSGGAGVQSRLRVLRWYVQQLSQEPCGGAINPRVHCPACFFTL